MTNEITNGEKPTASPTASQPSPPQMIHEISFQTIGVKASDRELILKPSKSLKVCNQFTDQSDQSFVVRWC